MKLLLRLVATFGSPQNSTVWKVELQWSNGGDGALIHNA